MKIIINSLVHINQSPREFSTNLDVIPLMIIGTIATHKAQQAQQHIIPIIFATNPAPKI
jgi:hypothetical protein